MLNNQKGASAAEVLLKFSLIFVISLCAFAVGTFVGKKFTEDQYRLSSLDEKQERDVASINEEEGIAPSLDISEEDLASLTEEFGETAGEVEEVLREDQKEAEALAEAAMQKLEEDLQEVEEIKETLVNQDTAPLAKDAPSKKIADRIATDTKPVIEEPKKAEPSRIPSSLPKIQAASRIGKYTVQVASYQTEKEAKEYTNELLNKGFTAFYIDAALKGKTWYRVSVGLFGNSNEANNYMKKLYQDDKLKGFVTKVVK